MLDVMDKEGMKGYCIVVNNGRIHDNSRVSAYIEARGYKPWFLPPYSPFLSPIEEFWSKVKPYTKKHPLDSHDNLTPRIVAACQNRLS
ncbi:hypothetical protein G6F43_008700 [Rhizopus delemar]|nr:hypothetical protein G6F43_008700 [Rhizopus delemar]